MDNKEHDTRKKRNVIIMIIIIIIILLLITSCTSKYWGRIGEYRNEQEVDVSDQTNDKKIIVNQDLYFDVENLTVSLSDEDAKLSFYSKNIEPGTLTCTTSNAQIATCFVKDGYVIVYPKKAGYVDVLLDTEVNGNIYRAKAKVIVEDADAYISLSSSSETLNLQENKKLFLSYSLIRLSGDVNVTIDDQEIADVSWNDGVITIVGKKTGKAKITVSVTYQSKVYTAVYQLTVISQKVDLGGAEKPKKDHDSSLKQLGVSKGVLDFQSSVYDYFVSVSYDVEHFSMDVSANSSKAKIEYKFNGKTVSSLQNLELNVGKNSVEIIVTAEYGSKTTYTVTVQRSEKVKSKENALKELAVSEGVLLPDFQEDVLDYHVKVSSSVLDIDVRATLKDSRAKVVYRYKGKVITSLENLPLDFGNNVLEIVVTSELGEERVYTVTIEKEKSRNNYLEHLTVSDSLQFTEPFNKYQTDYQLEVAYDQTSVTLQASTEDSKSQVHYQFNGKSRDHLKDLPLEVGDNKVTITVVSESGEERTYTVLIHRPRRTIEFDSKQYKVHVDGQMNLVYFVYDDGVRLDESKYDLDDIVVEWNDSFEGVIKKERGYIVVKPSRDMSDVTRVLTIRCGDSKDEATVQFIGEEFFLNTYTDYYDVDLTTNDHERSIVLGNNFFTKTITMVRTSYGVRICEEGNTDVYIDVFFDRTEMEISSISGNSFLVLNVVAKKAGNLKINISGRAYGANITDSSITIHSVQKYLLSLDANGGYFDEFTTSYVFKVEKGTEFDLSRYLTGYLEKEDCTRYEMIAFDSSKDGQGTRYDQTITLTKDTTLYAIYSDVPSTDLLVEEKTLYLSEVELFHNEEYYQLYNQDKIIYPGAHGSYLITLDNNTSSDIEIVSITLEEDTICVDQNGISGCLNMGYVLKDYRNQYYFGGSNSYEILYRHPKTSFHQSHTANTIPVPILVKKGESMEVSLLWEWVDEEKNQVQNQVDTLIGNLAGNDINRLYQLTVSIQFRKMNTTCHKNGD